MTIDQLLLGAIAALVGTIGFLYRAQQSVTAEQIARLQTKLDEYEKRVDRLWTRIAELEGQSCRTSSCPTRAPVPKIARPDWESANPLDK